MKYLTTKEISKIWNISDRQVRIYCKQGRIPQSFLKGKTWMIPENSEKPLKKVDLLHILKEQKNNKIKGGIYHKLQVEMTYNSNHIEGSKLSIEQTGLIFATKTIGLEKEVIKVDDIIETINHFKCIDFIIDNANVRLSEKYIKHLHLLLKTGTSDSNLDWFNVGEYKIMPNEVNGISTSSPKHVVEDIKSLLTPYNLKEKHTLEEIIDFHYFFETIHPFQDGNGRVGRLIMLKECLKNNLVPILIKDDYKAFYQRGLKEYKNESGYLIDTCLFGQDLFNKYLDYFKITY